MKILFIGDIFGKYGRQVIFDYLPSLKDEFEIDVCISNGENVAQGRGITEKTSGKLFEAGIDIFTSGNHLWDQRDSISFLETEKRILKPLNYPEKAIGNNYLIHTTANKQKLAVVCLIGQAFMGPANSPFETIDKFLPELRKKTKNILVDIHAEATAEKRAIGFYLDGRVSAVIGTHTHIQTADEEILPQGTAYITDVGMTGPHDSVIGIKKDIILERMVTCIPTRYEVSSEGLQINAIFINIDDKTGRTVEIQRIKRKV